MTMVVDSKQLAKRGTVTLNTTAAGGFMQLSEDSLRNIVPKLNGSPAGNALSNAMLDGTLVKGVAYVDKSTGELKIIRVNN